MSQSASLSQSAPARSSERKKKHPEKKIGPFANGIGCCVWINTVLTDDGPRQFRSVTINPRRYFDRESQEWKDAPSYNPADIPALLFAIGKAQEYCYETPMPDQPVSQSQAPPALPDDEIPF